MFKAKRKAGNDTLRTAASPQPSRMRCRYGRFLNLSYHGIQVFNKLKAMQPYFKPIDSCPVTHELLRTTCNYLKIYMHILARITPLYLWLH